MFGIICFGVNWVLCWCLTCFGGLCWADLLSGWFFVYLVLVGFCIWCLCLSVIVCGLGSLVLFVSAGVWWVLVVCFVLLFGSFVACLFVRLYGDCDGRCVLIVVALVVMFGAWFGGCLGCWLWWLCFCLVGMVIGADVGCGGFGLRLLLFWAFGLVILVVCWFGFAFVCV